MYIFAFSLSYIYISQINQLSMEIEPLSYEISVLQEQIESNTILETAITSYTLIESKELEEFITGYANQTGEKIRDLGEKDRNELLQPLSRLDEQIGLLVNSIKGKITSSELNYQILNTYAAYEALGKKERDIGEGYAEAP